MKSMIVDGAPRETVGVGGSRFMANACPRVPLASPHSQFEVRKSGLWGARAPC